VRVKGLEGSRLSPSSFHGAATAYSYYYSATTQPECEVALQSWSPPAGRNSQLRELSAELRATRRADLDRPYTKRNRSMSTYKG